MNKQEATDILIALACCTMAGLSCEECPRYVPDAEESEDVVMSENTCIAWNDDEIVEAVHILREGDYSGEAQKEKT